MDGGDEVRLPFPLGRGKGDGEVEGEVEGEVRRLAYKGGGCK